MSRIEFRAPIVGRTETSTEIMQLEAKLHELKNPQIEDPDVTALKQQIQAVNKTYTSIGNVLSDRVKEVEQARYAEYRALIEKSIGQQLNDKEVERVNQLRLLLSKSVERVESDTILLASHLRIPAYQQIRDEVVARIKQTKQDHDALLETYNNKRNSLDPLASLKTMNEIRDKFAPQISKLRELMEQLDCLNRTLYGKCHNDATRVESLKKHLGL